MPLSERGSPVVVPQEPSIKASRKLPAISAGHGVFIINFPPVKGSRKKRGKPTTRRTASKAGKSNPIKSIIRSHPRMHNRSVARAELVNHE